MSENIKKFIPYEERIRSGYHHERTPGWIKADMQSRRTRNISPDQDYVSLHGPNQLRKVVTDQPLSRRTIPINSTPSVKY